MVAKLYEITTPYRDDGLLHSDPSQELRKSEEQATQEGQTYAAIEAVFPGSGIWNRFG